MQNSNPRDYCTYKRFTARGPFVVPKGGRGRYGNRQAEARAPYPSISPDASRLSLSLRQVILLHRPVASIISPFLFPFSVCICLPCLLLHVCVYIYVSSFVRVSSVSLLGALQILKCRRESSGSVSPSVSVLSVGDGFSDEQKLLHNTLHRIFIATTSSIVTDFDW